MSSPATFDARELARAGRERPCRAQLLSGVETFQNSLSGHAPTRTAHDASIVMSVEAGDGWAANSAMRSLRPVARRTPAYSLRTYRKDAPTHSQNQHECCGAGAYYASFGRKSARERAKTFEGKTFGERRVGSARCCDVGDDPRRPKRARAQPQLRTGAPLRAGVETAGARIRAG